jgi:hypothetical protein
MLDSDLRAHALESLNVIIDGTRAEDAATGQRNFGFSQASEQGSGDVKTGAHPSHRLFGRDVSTQVLGINNDGITFAPHIGSDAAQYRDHRLNIANVGHVMQHALAFGGQQRSRQDW